jgi:hypothetical protein
LGCCCGLCLGSTAASAGGLGFAVAAALAAARASAAATAADTAGDGCCCCCWLSCLKLMTGPAVAGAAAAGCCLSAWASVSLSAASSEETGSGTVAAETTCACAACKAHTAGADTQQVGLQFDCMDAAPRNRSCYSRPHCWISDAKQ